MSQSAFAAEKCSKLLLSPNQALQAYLLELLERQVIGDQELKRFYDALESGNLVNAISEEDAQAKSSLFIHRSGLEDRMRSAGLDLSQLKIWARELLSTRGLIGRERDAVSVESSKLHERIFFRKINGAKFFIPETQGPTELTHRIEVMETPMTQMQWFELFNKNPSAFTEGPGAVFKEIKGQKIALLPDHPVERVTWWSALFAANKLSERHGLKPAYDLTSVKRLKGDPGEGTLESNSENVKINAPGENIYLAEGYRLPTDAELCYLILEEERTNHAKALNERAWLLSGGQTTHPVGTLAPLLVDSVAIYDLQGNVKVWAQDILDFYSARSRVRTGKDPIGQGEAPWRPLRGSNFECISPGGTSDASHLDASKRDRGIGVRLVRTIDLK